MKLQQIYDLGIEMAIDADPRGKETVRKLLEKAKKEHEDLPEKKKKYFDKESLNNPFADSRILYGDPQRDIKKIVAGIDADATEILTADRLNQRGAKIDLVITHHPSGSALAALHDVMDVQIDEYAKVGVAENVAQALMNERMSAVARRINPANHNQTVDTARLLEMPMLALHTIWDNIGDKFMRDYLDKKKFETVGEVFDYLMELPEFIEGTKGKAGPMIVSGSEKSRVGKLVVFFTGGTNPSKEMYVELAKAGVGTIIDMHIPEDALTELKKMHVNVINTGHIPSDSIGANIFLDELEKQGLEVMVFGGLVRVKRSKK